MLGDFDRITRVNKKAFKPVKTGLNALKNGARGIRTHGPFSESLDFKSDTPITQPLISQYFTNMK